MNKAANTFLTVSVHEKEGTERKEGGAAGAAGEWMGFSIYLTNSFEGSCFKSSILESRFEELSKVAGSIAISTAPIFTGKD